MTSNLNNNVSIGYCGNVKLSTYIGKRLIEAKTYKNKGALPLFQFLASCLAGNFPSAYHGRPYKIKLLKVTEKDTVEGLDNIKSAKDFTIDYDCTEFINLAAAPEVSYTENDSGCSCKVTFNFVFPYIRLKRSGANLVAIYGPGAQENESGWGAFCAYYLLTKNIVGDDSKMATVWDPVVLPENEDDLNKIFAVEWIMTLTNQTKQEGK